MFVALEVATSSSVTSITLHLNQLSAPSVLQVIQPLHSAVDFTSDINDKRSIARSHVTHVCLCSKASSSIYSTLPDFNVVLLDTFTQLHLLGHHSYFLDED